jgi:glycosyltransferase involved in cell wall biosynthesis
MLAGRFIASSGGEKYGAYLKKKIEENKLQNKLIMLKSIDHNAMADLYNAADLVLVPSFLGKAHRWLH